MDFGDASRKVIRKQIVDENLLKYECAICSINEWFGQSISLHLDHINGINNDNRLENLRFLCPNCHSLTPTYCGKNNKSKPYKKVSDEVLVDIMKTARNPSEALKLAGLSGAGNYQRIYRLAINHNIENMKKGYIKSKQNTISTFECVACKNEFVSYKPDSKYCSISCTNHHLHRSNPNVSDDEIYRKLEEFNFNYSKTGKHFNMSDNAIRYRVRRLKS